MDGGKALVSAVSMESLNSVSTESCSQVRTLFVSGLPMDAKPRELYLLFRSYRGYESSLLKMTAKNGKPTSPVGFVTFQTSKDADEARKALQGVRFDPDCAQVLRLELAKPCPNSSPLCNRPKRSCSINIRSCSITISSSR
ncbi:hypothetical protein Q1695_009957 [Nippostrongylus brasiliensis]|nr:hypothetical protein Q1695_009957 [Nippostrongylus brasiliensis]